MSKRKTYDPNSPYALGRFLCKILRHDPSLIGITVDSHGWANVDELIAGVQKTRSLDRQTLEQLVANDAKQRYSFDESHTRIRCNQGHSFYVDVEMPLVDPPEILYHGTAANFAASIDAQGLLPGNRLYVHLSSDVPAAKKVGARHGSPIVYHVLSGQMARDGYLFYRSVNGVWQTKYVPAHYLRREESV